MRIVVDDSLAVHTRAAARDVIRGVFAGMPKADRLVVDALYVGQRWSVRVILMPDAADPHSSTVPESQRLLEDVIRARLDGIARIDRI